MTDENRPVSGNRRASDGDSSDGREPLMPREEPRQLADRIAQRLRNAGHDIAIVNPVLTKASVRWWDRFITRSYC